MNAAIVDDEPIFLIQITDLLKNISKEQGFNINIDSFQNTEEFKAQYTENKYDVLFLDIDMPGMNGFELTEMLRTQNDRVHIVFITNRDDLIIHAFRYKVLGFVRKKHLENELPYAVSSIIKEMNLSASTVLITEVRSQGGKTKTVAIDDIFYIEINSHDAHIFLSDGSKLIVRKSLSEFLGMPGFNNFILINSGTIVNLAKAKLDDIKIILPDGTTLFISKRKMKEVREAYLKSLRRILI